MVTDISDRYPSFHVNRQVKAKDAEIYMEKRVYSDTKITVISLRR